MLKKWKTEVAKVSVSYFEEMNESAKKICTSVNKLRCNMHFLLTLADAAEKGLNEDDKIVQNDGVTCSKLRIQKHGESGPTRTIRTLCKAFQKHRSAQAGVMSHFAVHLRNSPVKLTSFRGNRFNISFWNPACVLFHQRHFMSFFLYIWHYK